MPSFVDEAQVHVKGGDGGAGAVAFRREAHVARGGPDGGDGGRGGDVVLEASAAVVSLLAFRDHPHRRAGSGGHGGGARRHGRGGDDLVVAVPVGTIVRTLDGTVLADLAANGDRLLAAAGGRGGHGNARFLSNKLRAPAFAEQGEAGEERWLDLELKLLADVALVGFPNAGKSTLISKISAAKPKIADYPFTTLEPHLGVVRVAEQAAGARRSPRRRPAGAPLSEDGGASRAGGDRVAEAAVPAEGATPAEVALVAEGGAGSVDELVVADIPGLIEGASKGRGLGDRFLRHVERARALVVLIDLASYEREPRAQLDALLHELGQYRPELLERPRLVVGSRVDALPADEWPDPASFGGELLVSSLTGEGLAELVAELARLVAASRVAGAAAGRAPVVHRPVVEGVEVVREGATFVVLGREASRAVALSDLTDPAALAHVQRRLRRLGVDRALARAGARAGDPVRIGTLELTYEPDR